MLELHLRERFKKQLTPQTTLDWKAIYRLTLEEIEEERVYNFHLFQSLRPSKYYIDFINLEKIKYDDDDEEKEHMYTVNEKEKERVGEGEKDRREPIKYYDEAKTAGVIGYLIASSSPMVAFFTLLVSRLISFFFPSAARSCWRRTARQRWKAFWSSFHFLPFFYAPNRYTFFNPYHYVTKKRRLQERLNERDSRSYLMPSTTSSEHATSYWHRASYNKSIQDPFPPAPLDRRQLQHDNNRHRASQKEEEGSLLAYYQSWKEDHTCLYNPINYIR